MPTGFWHAAADAILLLHLLFVLFVIIGLLAVWLGHLIGWQWVRHRRFRQLHLLAIGVVVAQAWLGQLCPLTVLEQWLRQQAGAGQFDGSFLAHYLHQWLFFQAPWWVFVLAYTLFALAVLLSWWWVPPNPGRKR
ncbi:DUF2784 domain-containing protein [Ferrimonas balearica]|uniref:DUF2784 domain-containing protein n=1 Tax=Ferrimonas balearica TaxID=44012 RepID=UPI001C96D8F1|nr:DUF2784 domain-containing protein [Ferrimonas balearica]MBY6226110.1 DUF2784 domain-containing protein [Ferrimonas balearica]